MTWDISPCTESHERPRRGGWGTVRTRVATTVGAPPDRLATLLLDYAHWARLFPETIEGAELVRRDGRSLVVLVQHRREGRVLNVLTDCGDGIVALREYKHRYDATFVNRFARTEAGTCFTIDAEVRVKRPFSAVGPLLRGVVARALRRYTMEPLRAAAEAQNGRDRR
jgi:hypothetical protein